MHKSCDDEFGCLYQNNNSLKDIPIILYTPLGKKHDSDWIKEKGFKASLTKPIKKQELIDTMVKIINNDCELSHSKYDIHNKNRDNANLSLNQVKILIVEDNEMNCKLMQKVFDKNRLHCEFAYNGQEAISKFQTNEYNLILMDCQMPVLDGYTATSEIRKLEPEGKHTPIIAMTANALHNDKEKCLNAGMDDYISKPINIDELLFIINKYVELATNQNIIGSIVNKMACELSFNQEESIQIFTEFLEYLSKTIIEFKTAFNNDDTSGIKQIVHKLKGSSSNLRIESITKICMELEYCIDKNEERKAYADAIEQLSYQVQYLNTELENFIQNGFSLQK